LRVKGLISYLNRERDPTTFAIPTIKTINVGIGAIDVPDVRGLARGCLSVIAGSGKQTRKKSRRTCYLSARSEYTRKYKTTQRSQLAECFGAKAAKPDFPSYTEFVNEMEGVENTESVESDGTTGAIVGKL